MTSNANNMGDKKKVTRITLESVAHPLLCSSLPPGEPQKNSV